jgi:hypothetical protein
MSVQAGRGGWPVWRSLYTKCSATNIEHGIDRVLNVRCLPSLPRPQAWRVRHECFESCDILQQRSVLYIVRVYLKLLLLLTEPMRNA